MCDEGQERIHENVKEKANNETLVSFDVKALFSSILVKDGDGLEE